MTSETKPEAKPARILKAPSKTKYARARCQRCRYKMASCKCQRSWVEGL